MIKSLLKFSFLLLFLSLFSLVSCLEGPADQPTLLFDFESDSELDFITWKCRSLFSLTKEHKGHGEYSLKMDFFPTDQVGFSTARVPRDWSNSETFNFWVFNPSTKKQIISIKFTSASKKGENSLTLEKRLEILPGDNTVIIPISLLEKTPLKGLQVDAILGLYIFMKDIKTKTILYFDHIRLT